MGSSGSESDGVSIVLGQGLAGSALAWSLHWARHRVEIIDRGERESASRIAAGLITPVSGRRFAKAEDFDQNLAAAAEYYRRVESVTGRPLLEMKPAVRYFSDTQERDNFLNERATEFRDEVELIESSEGQVVGFRMLKAGRLHVSDYLNSTRDYFVNLGQYHQADVNVATDVVPHKHGVSLRNPGIEGTRLFFCQGFQIQGNPWFPGIPDAPSRGEILQVRIAGRSDQQVIHGKYWLAPVCSPDLREEGHQYIVGASYDRDNLELKVTDQGRVELLQALRQFTTEEAEVTGQFTAIRAGTRQRRPVCQVHATYPQLFVLNGLGSRGALLAPVAAQRVIELISGSSSRSSTIRKEEQRPRSLTKLAHSIVRRAIKPGETVIDATAGNGHDTEFLKRCTGPGGQVIAIDIQESAIQSTRTRLDAAGLSGVQLQTADHSLELSRLEGDGCRARAIMFNLGYLPGGDKQQTTKPASTLKAITTGLRMLCPGGVMTVIAYRGHSGGQQEAQAVNELANREKSNQISVDIIPGSEDNSESPVLFVFRRKQGVELADS